MTLRASELILFDDYGLSAFTFRPESENGWQDDVREQASHTHLELELFLVENGTITVEHTSRHEQLSPGEIVAFWAGLPHRVADVDSDAIYHVAQVPIVNVLSWIDSTEIVDGLLSGDFIKSVTLPAERVTDPTLFARWSSDLASADSRLRAAAELEIKARLLRFIHHASPTSPNSAERNAKGAATVVADSIRYITRHFMEHITVDDIANAVGRHHDYVMTSFRRICALTLWEYVTRLRLNEAQRLLAVTNLPILAICHRAGFSSPSRMYEAFHRYCGQTPAAYRQRTSL